MTARCRRCLAIAGALVTVLAVPIVAAAFTPEGFVAQDDPGSERTGILYSSPNQDEISPPRLGRSLAFSGDLLAVAGSGHQSRGIVYVYRNGPAGWLEEDFFAADWIDPGAGFGAGLATDGEYIVIGAPGETDGSDIVQDAGGLYFYKFDGTNWYKHSWNNLHSGRYGASIDIDGDTMAVGASSTNLQGPASGSVCIYTKSDGSWTHATDVTPSDGQTDDFFGAAVAVDGDTLVVGAHGEDDGGYLAGAVYIFTRQGSAWTQRKKIISPSAEYAGNFGYDVDLQDGTLVVAALTEDAAGDDSGAAYVFEGGGSTWSQVAKLLPAFSPASGNVRSVVIDGDTIALGADGDSRGGAAASAGAAYVFRKLNGLWVRNQKLFSDPPLASQQFGFTVGAHDGEVFVGARGDDGGGRDNSGAVYRYKPLDIYRVAGGEQLQVAAPGVLGNDMNPTPVSVSASGVSQPSHGVLTIYGSGAFTYTPTATYSGLDSFTYMTTSTLGAVSQATVNIEVYQHFEAVAGQSRYSTAVEASKRAYPTGADTVVIATGEDWPDALGGSALAGAVNGPLLITTKASLASPVKSEIVRLKAKKAYILGGTAAVSSAVESSLKSMLGAGNVERVAGKSRYATALAIANKVVALEGASFDGKAFVATGLNFPDALGASPVAAAKQWPILLAPKDGMPLMPSAVMNVTVLGGTGAVTAKTESTLKSKLGTANVTRVGGNNRFDTAARTADAGVVAGLRWDGVGVATGMDFPDALAGGAMLGGKGTVALLTKPDVLAPEARARLTSNKTKIDQVHFLGGKSALSDGVRNAAKQALQ